MLFSIVLGVIMFIILWRLWSKDQDPLDDLPGPPTVPVLGNTLLFLGLKQGKMYLVLNNADETWQRACVRSVDRRNVDKFVYRVFCVDFGSTETVTVEHEPEPQILDYVTQQHKVFIAIASSHAFSLISGWISNLYVDVSGEMASGKINRLPEVDAVRSQTKEQLFPDCIHDHNLILPSDRSTQRNLAELSTESYYWYNLYDGSLLLDIISEMFNSYFQSVFEPDDGLDPDLPISEHTDAPVDMSSLDISEKCSA